jgi:Flp pilus assembly protein TadG
MITAMARRLRDDGGQSALELVVMAPCVIALVMFIVAGARLVNARSDLEATAREAAVAAVAASPSTASSVAQQVGAETASGYGMDPKRLQLNGSGTIARGDTFTVVVRYNVSLAPMPGSMTLVVPRPSLWTLSGALGKVTRS